MMNPAPRIPPTVRVWYHDEMPAELRDGVELHITANLDLLPAWCAYLAIYFDSSLEVPAQMRPRIDYRQARLTIGHCWLDCDVEYRRRCIVHEFAHVTVAPLHILGARLIDIAGKGNEALDEDLREQFRIALEQTTCDLEDLHLRLLRRGDGDGTGGESPASLSRVFTRGDRAGEVTK